MKIGKFNREFIDIPDAVAEFPIRALQLGLPTNSKLTGKPLEKVVDEDTLPEFERFIENYVVPCGITHITLSLYYNFDYPSHPEIVDHPCITVPVARRMAEICHRNGIEIVPEIDFPAHQSTIRQNCEPYGLLRAYPDLEECPAIGEEKDTAEVCPSDPRLRPIIYDMIDDMMDAFDTRVIHTGFDEVYSLGSCCPRCSKIPRHRLFAGLINDLNAHVRARGGTMWIWGDRLLKGDLFPLISCGGETNPTDLWKALDLISKDIVICDWHYFEEPYGQLTPGYWAMKGFQHLSCPFNSVRGAEQLVYSTRVIKELPTTLGVFLTTWCDMLTFMDLVEQKYADYAKTGELKHDPSLELCNVENATHYADMSSNVFLKMFVRTK